VLNSPNNQEYAKDEKLVFDELVRKLFEEKLRKQKEINQPQQVETPVPSEKDEKRYYYDIRRNESE
jgi:hypothetical protein